MKRKISLQELAEYLVQREACGRDEADTLVRAFFEVIEQGLLTDKFVKIKGLGTFKLVAVSERESVNINTGERFQIGGHTKISFTPDASMKELVNRPFAHFESVDLDDDTDLAEFDYVDHLIEQNMAEEAANAEAQAEPQASAEAEEDSNELAEAPIEIEDAPQEESLPHDEAEDDASSFIELHAVAEQAPEVLTEAPAETEKEPLPAEELPIAVEAETPSAEELQAVDEEPLQANQPAPEAPTETSACAAATANAHASATVPPTSSHADEQVIASDPFEYTYTEKPPRRKLDRWKIAAIILGIVLLMTLCYFAGYFRVLCPCSLPFVEELMQPKPAPEPQVTVPAPQPKPAVAAPTSQPKPMPKAQPEAKPAPAPTAASHKEQPKPSAVAQKPDSVKHAAPQQPRTHTVKVGDNLYKISRRYYGTDAYVPAIIKLNKLRNADNITVGKRLKLP